MEVFDFDQVITHSTTFHADDVFGVAMCRLIDPKIEIIRTLEDGIREQLERNKHLGKKAIIFDIGLGKYDHHQSEAEGKALRPESSGTYTDKNGMVKRIPYCGFGLLWRDFGYLLCKDPIARDKVDQTLVLQIDKADNGVSMNLLSSSIRAMNPKWNENVSESVAFHRAMNVAMIILQSFIDQANSEVEARTQVMACFDGTPILVLDKYMPWNNLVSTDEQLKDVLFVVYPSQRGGWAVQAVKKDLGSFENRMNFPEEWLGHADPERGIHFAHTSNFLIACNTKEQAVKVAKEAVEAGNKYAEVAYSI